MKQETFLFPGSDGMPLHAVLWLPDAPVRAVLQIGHGMTEHILRYQAFAQNLTAHGIAVAGMDLRGHGKNPGDPNCASMGENGWETTLQDMHVFFHHLGDLFPGAPHYMLGFSLSSFLLREYLGRYPQGVAGAILAGTGQEAGFLMSIMRTIVTGEIKKCGFDGTTALVKKLSNGVYNDKFKPNRTEVDWLCSDNQQLDECLADTLCRNSISAGLFHQLLSSIKRTGSLRSYETWNKDMPVLLISGDQDAVGSFGKGVAAVEKTMVKAGLTNLRCHMFPGARHDLFHECANGTAAGLIPVILDWMEF